MFGGGDKRQRLPLFLHSPLWAPSTKGMRVTQGPGSTGTKNVSACFTRSCGRRQRASAGAAGGVTTRAKTTPCDGPRRANPGAALGFGFGRFFF
jgi:hypothetical protein